MNCESVINNFQNILLEKIEASNLSKDLSIHLQNCNYCQKDCQKLVFDYVSQPNSNKEVSQIAYLLFKPTEINISYQFTLLNYDSFPTKLLKELQKATVDFIDNPIGFIKETVDIIFEKQDSPYWDKSVSVATLIWLSSCVSIVLYGGFGWWWFSSNNIDFKPKPNNLFDNTQVYYINASLPYPPTYWSRNVSKIDSNKTTLAVNKSLATKTSSKSKGSFAEPTNLEASLSTKINSSIGSTKTPTPEIRGYSFFGEPAIITNSNNVGIAKETKGSLVTGGRFINSNTAQISTTDIGKDDDAPCCDDNNMCAECIEEKAMEEKVLKEKASKAFEFGNAPKVSLSLASPNNNRANVSIVATPNTVSGGGTFISDNTPDTGNSTTEESKAVEVEARSIPPTIKAGRLGYLSIILKPYVENPLLTNFTATLQFNSSLVKINKVSDGGLMSLYGVNPDFNYSISKNSVKINISCPANAKAVKAFGQLILIGFEAIAPGFADFTLTDVQLLGVNGEILPIALVNSQTEVVGN